MIKDDIMQELNEILKETDWDKLQEKFDKNAVPNIQNHPIQYCLCGAALYRKRVLRFLSRGIDVKQVYDEEYFWREYVGDGDGKRAFSPSSSGA